MAPTFATPLQQSTRSEMLEWSFPKPYSHLVLTGKSRAAWHTSFVIPQLNLLLDAGLCVNNLRPKHIFITHGHADHSLLAFAFVKSADPPDVFVPEELETTFDRYVLATTLMNLGGDVDGNTEEEEENESIAFEGQVTPRAADKDSHAHDTITPEQSAAVAEQNKPKWELDNARLVNTHVTHGVRADDIVPLRRLKDVSAQVFACDHSVPCVGYVFRTTSYRLRPELAHLPGAEIAKLRKSGAAITYPHTVPIFAFLGDTTAKTLADEPAWLREGVPVVVTECSFLYEEHRAQAEKTKHTIWADLEPVVRKFGKTTFVLTHFSLRYSEKDVRLFFEGLEGGCPGNVVVWVDGMD